MGKSNLLLVYISAFWFQHSTFPYRQGDYRNQPNREVEEENVKVELHLERGGRENNQYKTEAVEVKIYDLCAKKQQHETPCLVEKHSFY